MADARRASKRPRPAAKELDDSYSDLLAFGKGREPYVPRRAQHKSADAERRAAETRRRLGLSSADDSSLAPQGAKRDRRDVLFRSGGEAPRAGAAGAAAAAASSKPAVTSSSSSSSSSGGGIAARPGMTLMDELRAHVAAQGGQQTSREKRKALEADLLRQVLSMQQKALMSAKEHASGVAYTKPLLTDWRPTKALAGLSKAEADVLRAQHKVEVEGEGIPAPCPRFADMRLPPAVMTMLKAKGILRPTPIQVQGLPVALSGRDLIGVAFTGSGKTLVFTLPLMLLALQEELRMPLAGGEGPFGILLAPARDLASQTHSICEEIAEAMASAGLPRLRCMLSIGGMSVRDQIEPLSRSGVHVVVATPGRLLDHLQKGRMNLSLCRYVCLDEGDRMLDAARGFEDELKQIFSFFDHQRQTLIFSATMPRKVREFAMGALVEPVTVNSGRAGAASMDVIQEVEHVRDEAKMIYLLECLQKTAPPVMIFSKRSREVDDITQYLLLKGVEATSVHGGKDQADRNLALQQFRDGSKDVLVATDVAAKGLDFPSVQHVINFDMPESVENYVHRVGRTGRGGKTGVATTFINKSVPESVLLDLKHLLRAAKQRIPPALLALDDPHDAQETDEDGNLAECVYCQGFGHSILSCEKLQRDMKVFDSKFRDGLRDD